MDVELGFRVGDRYSIALLVFFITYFIFEIPSNVVLRKVGAANWLAFLCMSWGLVTFGAGFAKKWTDIVVCRLLLGLFEAVSLVLVMFLPPTDELRASSQDQCKLKAASSFDS
jgi:MFS family permease